MKIDLGVVEISKYAISALATAKKQKRQQSTVRIQSKALQATTTHQTLNNQVKDRLLGFTCWLIVKK